jgi:tetratricopeptide (TPR) repeat protein
LGGLPLALEQAGAYVAATGTVTLAGYGELFGTRALELLNRGQPLGYQHTVATTWSLALERLRESEPAAVDLLTLASFLAPDDLPLPLLAAQAQELSEPLASVTADPLALADAVAALRRYSLVRVVGDGLYVHRLLQTVVRAGLAGEAQQTWAAIAVRLLRAAFPVESDQVVNWQECERLLPHALAATGHATALSIDPIATSGLLHRAGRYLWARAEHAQAKTLHQHALAIREARLGPDHPDTAQSLHNLGLVLQDLGDLHEARELHKRALRIREAHMGPDHPATASSLNQLGRVLAAQDDLAGARSHLERALAIRRIRLGADHPDTAQSVHNLALVLAALGDLEAARQLHEKALDARRRVLGEGHPDTIQSAKDLAKIRRVL